MSLSEKLDTFIKFGICLIGLAALFLMQTLILALAYAA